jgi:hypothetical protein
MPWKFNPSGTPGISFILTLVRFSTELNFRIFVYQRAIYGELQMEHFPLFVDGDLYANKSSKFAFRNQYISLLSFQEIFKSGRMYLPIQRVISLSDAVRRSGMSL